MFSWISCFFCRIASHVTDANSRSVIGMLVVHYLLIEMTQYSSFSVNCCLDKILVSRDFFNVFFVFIFVIRFKIKCNYMVDNLFYVIYSLFTNLSQGVPTACHNYFRCIAYADILFVSQWRLMWVFSYLVTLLYLGSKYKLNFIPANLNFDKSILMKIIEIVIFVLDFVITPCTVRDTVFK